MCIFSTRCGDLAQTSDHLDPKMVPFFPLKIALVDLAEKKGLLEVGQDSS